MIRSARRRVSLTWANLPLRGKGLVVVAIPLAVLLLTALSAYLIGRYVEQADLWVLHTFQVRTETENVRVLLIETETGVRGYLLTGREEWLEPYHNARRALPDTFARLETLIADNPVQSGRLRRIRSLADQRLAVLDQIRPFAPVPGNESARPPDGLLVQGNTLMDGLRRELSDMDAVEDQLLAERRARADRATALGHAALAAGVLFGLGGGLLATLLFTAGVVRRTERLEVNARRLARGLPLLVLPPGEDEVGRLGRRLVETGALLAERERELREARGFLEYLVASSPGLIVRLAAPDLGATYISPNVERVLGYAPEEALGTPAWWRDHIHPEQRQCAVAEAQRAVEAHARQIEQEWRFLHQDGAYRWLYAVLRPEYDAGGRPAGLLMYLLDITERKEAEEEIRRGRVFLDSVIENIPTMVFIKDAEDLRFLRFNRAGEDLLGHARTDLIGKNDYDFFPNDEAEFFTAKDREVLQGRTLVDIPEESIQTRHRGLRTLHTRKIPLLAADGSPQYLLGISEDITERKQAEDALRASEERLARTIETMADGVVLLDRDGRFTLANAAAERILGLERSHIVDAPYDAPPWTRLTLDGRPFPLEDYPFERVQRTRRAVYDVEFLIERPDGVRTTISVNAAPLRDAGGEFAGMVASFTDITERKRAQEELAQARDEADRANAAKSEFLSRMSHELRTPMNAILGFAQLLELDPLDEEQRESVAHILKAGRHLLDLINEVLDIARIEAGRLALSPEPVRAGDILQESIELVEPLAVQRHIRLDGATAAGCDHYVQADRQRLKQVLLNLLANAVKYTHAGGMVTVRCAEAPPERLRLIVCDTGPGIPPDNLERLFVPFDRLEAEHSGIEGTGLGLTLSRRLVEAMGGTIGVESEVGRGSTFWVELPLVESQTARLERLGEDVLLPLDAGRPRPARTLLYIEDNLSNLQLVERILGRRPEVKLLPAMQGRLGLELAREHRPDLILLDLHLPDIDGDEVLRRVRLDSVTRDIPVVMVTADATPGQVQRLLAAGAQAYLTKPLDIRQLLRVLDETMI